jgi:hypothetical protein
MQKLLLVSLLIATVALPMRAARARSARLGLRRAVFWMLAFNILYLLAVRLVYPRL